MLSCTPLHRFTQKLPSLPLSAVLTALAFLFDKTLFTPLPMLILISLFVLTWSSTTPHLDDGWLRPGKERMREKRMMTPP
jgi:hypothetical protein